jgi:hypothetical protein
MHVVLLALGTAVSVVGLVLIAFAMPIDLAALGNTLVVVGTVAIVGSLILIGIASAIRQLRRIAQALEARPAPRVLAQEGEEPAPRLHSPVLTPPSEPRFQPVAEPPPLPPEPVVEPLVEPAPEPPQRAAPDVVAERLTDVDVAPEPPPEPQMSEPPPLPEPPPVPESPPREPPPMREPPPTPQRVFDAIWSGEADVREREVVAATATATMVAERPAPRVEAPAAEPEVRIFKSGVIDGMAYTLYTDGSIEAELAQGTVTFASIDELRAYLAARE